MLARGKSIDNKNSSREESNMVNQPPPCPDRDYEYEKDVQTNIYIRFNEWRSVGILRGFP